MQKTCRTCGVSGPETRFTRAKRSADGYANICRSCNNKASKESRLARRAKTPEKVREWERNWYATHKYLSARHRAKKRGLSFELSEARFDQLQAETNCGFCGKLFSKELRFDTLTIDRVDTNGPYADWNCAAICHGCNARKNNMTPSDLRALANWIENTIDALAKFRNDGKVS